VFAFQEATAMDRAETLGIGRAGRRQPDPAAGVLPSRAAAIEACRAALEGSGGPVLLTGAAGVGKTWLWRHLAADRPGDERWMGVDLTPLSDACEFFGRIGYALGLPEADSVEEARRALADELRERAADGRRWVLVVDEAQNASAGLLEEIRILSNRLGRSDGVAGLLLVGQTALTRRIETRSLAALEARLVARVHLRSLDVDEARTLLIHLVPGRAWAWPEVEVLHREASGIPQRLLRLAAHLPATRRDGPPAAELAPMPAPPPATVEVPRIVPSRPPLRIEDGLIEVGWEPQAEPAPESAPTGPRAPSTPSGNGDGSPEVIDDHYAALQAWNEWAQNQGRHPASAPSEAEAGAPGGPPAAPSGPYVWAEGQQSFAPYSQLFSRLRQANDAE
jgi:type II secretory pathway predicted ATPase ExeA